MNAPNYLRGPVLLVFILIWSSDTFAYLTGRAFGKTPLHAELSPKKTWEGFIGGTLLTAAVGAYCFYAFMAIPALLITLIAQYKPNQIGGYTQKLSGKKLLGSTLLALGMIPLVALSTAFFKHLPVGNFAGAYRDWETRETIVTGKQGRLS